MSRPRQTREERADRAEELAEHERLLRNLAAIVEWSDDAITSYTPEGTVQTWNCGAERLYGYAANEMIGLPIFPIIPEERRREWQEFTRAVMSGNRLGAVESVRRAKSNRLVEVSLRLSPLREAAGAVIGVSSIARDITGQKLMEQKLKSSREELRALAARLTHAREEEALRISREVHDGLGACLTAVNIDLARMEQRVAGIEDPTARADLLERITTMAKLVLDSQKTVQRIASALRPGVLDDLGLTAALEWQAAEFQKRAGIFCEWQARAETKGMDNAAATAVFRIFQEILTNVARHAEATQVTLDLRRSGGHLILTVKDNGKGFNPASLGGSASLGVIGMQERALLAGGEIEIRNCSGHGTMVMVKVPY